MANFIFNYEGVEGTALYGQDELMSTTLSIHDFGTQSSNYAINFYVESKVFDEDDENTYIDEESFYYEIDGVKYTNFEWDLGTQWNSFKEGQRTKPIEIDSRNVDEVVVHAVTKQYVGGGGRDGYNVTGFNYVYLVDKEILQGVASERYEVHTGGGDVDIVDLGQFIINVLQIPFTIDEDFIGDKNVIRLGHAKLETKAAELKTDLLEVDLGNIEVPATYGNSFDYLNTEVDLYLPFVDSIRLDENLVIGETLNVKYIYDLYTGNVSINITTSKNEIVHSETTTIGRQIPFMQTMESSMLFSDSSKQGLDNEIETVYIVVSRNIPLNTDSLFNSSVIDSGLLNEFNGYVEISNIDLKTTATLQEKSDILNILRNGVIINGN